MTDWIKVEDRLPEVNGNYLCKIEFMDGGDLYSYLCEVESYICPEYGGHDWVSVTTGDDFNDGCVTHWMPLPEPPKSEV